MNAKMKNFTGKVLVIAVCTLALLVLTTPVAAKLQVAITVYDTTDPTIFYNEVIKDGDPEDADHIVNNEIDINSPYAPIPGFSVQGSFSTSKSGGLSLITTAESTVQNNRDTATRAFVAVSDTDFNPTANLAIVTSSGTFTNAVGSTMYNGFYDDPLNNQGADYDASDYADFNANIASLTPGNKIDDFTFTSNAAILDSFSHNKNDIVVSDTNPYSMTMVFDFTLTPHGELSAHAQNMAKNQTSVPEFPSLALPAAMVFGLLGAVLFVQRTKEQ
jgi:hypothetical protein